MIILRVLAAITALVVTLTAAARVAYDDPTPTPALIATAEPYYSEGNIPPIEAPAAYPPPAVTLDAYPAPVGVPAHPTATLVSIAPRGLLTVPPPLSVTRP